MEIKKIKSRYTEAELLKDLTAYTAHADEVIENFLPSELLETA